jgi:O-antigen/teichoic acid export membrane protein
MSSEPNGNASEHRATPRPDLRAVARGVLWSAGGTAGSRVISFVAFLMIARALAPEEFGLVALASLFVHLLSVLVEQGFVQALVQRPELEPEHLDTAFWTNGGLSLLMAGVLLSTSGVLARAFGEPTLGPVLQVLSIGLPMGSLTGVQTAILQREMRFGDLALRTLVATLVGGAVGVGMAWSGYGVWALVGQILTAHFATVVVLWSVATWRPRLAFSRRHLHELWAFGLNVLGSSLVNFANARAADLFIGSLLGKAALGLYAVSWRIVIVLLQLFVGATSRVAFSSLARLQGDVSEFRRAYYAGVQLTAAIAIPIFVGLSMLGPDLVSLMLGAQWERAGNLVRILAFIGVLATFGSYNSIALSSLGRPDTNLRLDVLNAAATVLAVGLAWPWGVEAVALAFVARAHVLVPIRYAALGRISGVTFPGLWRVVSGSTVSTAAMAGVLTLIRATNSTTGSPYADVALLMVAGAVTYMITLTLVSRDTVRLATRVLLAALDRGRK